MGKVVLGKHFLFCRLAERRKWSTQSLVLYLTHFRMFVKYVHAYERSSYPFDLECMLHAINELRTSVSHDLAKSRRKAKRAMFAKVPSHALLRLRKQNVIDLLKKDLEEKKLNLQQLKALNFFLMQVRLNTRSGPLLKLKWKQFENILKKGLTLETDDHKTGHVYDVCLRLEKDQIQFFEEMRSRTVELYGHETEFVFSNSKFTQETRMAQLLCMTFQELFGDDPDEVRFNANSVRKFWEKRIQAIGIPSNFMNAHLAQTAHAQKTADMHYVGLEAEDRGKLMDLYNKDLNEEVEDDNVDSSDTDSLESDEDTGTCVPSEEPCPPSTSSARPTRANAASVEVEVEPPQPSSPVPAPRPRSMGRISLNSTCDLRMGSPRTTKRQLETHESPAAKIAKPDNKKLSKREKFIKSMKKFRDTKNHIWTEEEKKACEAFYTANNSNVLKDVRETLKEVDIELSDCSYKFIYAKIKSAFQVAESATTV